MSVKHNGSLSAALAGDRGDYQYDKATKKGKSGRRSTRLMRHDVTKRRRRLDKVIEQQEIDMALEPEMGLESADCEFEYGLGTMPNLVVPEPRTYTSERTERRTRGPKEANDMPIMTDAPAVIRKPRIAKHKPRLTAEPFDPSKVSTKLNVLAAAAISADQPAKTTVLVNN